MKSKITLLLLLLIGSLANPLMAQDDKTATLTVSGQGKNESEAKQEALRNAIEQAFGTFISSNTSILNDNLVKDEIVSVSSGNIQKYDVLNTSTLPDGTAAVTLSAVVSVSKLISFSEAKGVVIEFKGGLFTINVKQQILNEQAEVKAIWDMLFMLNPIAFQSFDYTIQTKDPQSLDAENKNWAVPVIVTATANKNIDFLFDYFKKNLAAIALKNEEVANYTSLNKKVFPITLDGITYNLRKNESKIAIYAFLEGFPFYMRNYIVENGFSKQSGQDLKAADGDYSQDFYPDRYGYYPFRDIHFDRLDWDNIVSLHSTSQAGAWVYNDLKSLSELEKLSGYKVSPIYPKSKVGSWYGGGIIFHENGKGGGLITAINGFVDGNKVINGFNDWYSPSQNELNFLKMNVIFLIQSSNINPYPHELPDWSECCPEVKHKSAVRAY